MPNKTIYIKDADLKIWNKAQKDLGESISSGFIDYLRMRLETNTKPNKGRKLNMIEAMDELLLEINKTYKLNIERHPSWSPIILDSMSVNIGYKLHQTTENPNRVMSVLVFPLEFDADGRLNTRIKNLVTEEVKKFWNGKCTEQHHLVNTSDY